MIKMHHHELCTHVDTFIEYLLIPLVAIIVFFIVINPWTIKFFAQYICEGFWVSFFGAVLLFVAVYIAVLFKKSRKDCINRGTLCH